MMPLGCPPAAPAIVPPATGAFSYITYADPCPGVLKVAAVSYSCLPLGVSSSPPPPAPPPSQAVSAMDGQTGTLTCPAATVIAVVDVAYGGVGLNCSATIADEEAGTRVTSACNGQQQCAVLVSAAGCESQACRHAP